MISQKDVLLAYEKFLRAYELEVIATNESIETGLEIDRQKAIKAIKDCDMESALYKSVRGLFERQQKAA